MGCACSCEGVVSLEEMDEANVRRVVRDGREREGRDAAERRVLLIFG